MAERRDLRADIGYRFDPRGGQQFIQQNKQAAQSVGELQAAMTKENVTAAEYARRSVEFIEAQDRAARSAQQFQTGIAGAARSLREKIAAARESITTDTEQTRVIENQTRALQRYQAVRNQQAGFAAAALPDPSFAAVTGQGGGGRRRTLGGLGTFGTAVRNLPDVGPSTEISNVLIGFDRITGAMGLSAEAALRLAGITGGVAAGFVAIYAALEPGRQATRQFIQNTRDYNEAILNSSRAQVQAIIQAREAELIVAEANLRDFQTRLDQQAGELRDSVLNQLGFGTQAESIERIFNVEGLNDLIAGRDQESAKVEQLRNFIDQLNTGLAEGATAGRDAAEAFGGRFRGAVEGATQLVSDFVRENDERIRAQISATEAEIATNRRILDLRRNFSQERLDQLRQENADEQNFNNERIRRLERYEGRSTAADEELARARERQNELLREATLLYDPYLRQLEQQAKFLNTINNLGVGFGRVFGSLRDDLSGLDVSRQLNKITEITNRRDERIAELQDQRRDREAQAEAEYNKAIADADRKAADDRLKLFEDNYKRILDIERRFTRSYTQAVGDRDALAAYNARITREDELQKLKDSNDERTKEIEETLNRERQIADERRRETLRIAEDTANKEIAKVRQKAQAEIDIQNASIDAQLRAAFQFTNTLNNLFNTSYTQMINNAQQAAATWSQVFLGNQTVNGGAIGNLLNSVFGGGSNPNLGTPVQVPLPGGGSQPGYAVPVQSIGPGQPGYVVQFSPQINGANVQQVRSELQRGVDQVVNIITGKSSPR